MPPTFWCGRLRCLRSASFSAAESPASVPHWPDSRLVQPAVAGARPGVGQVRDPGGGGERNEHALLDPKRIGERERRSRSEDRIQLHHRALAEQLVAALLRLQHRDPGTGRTALVDRGREELALGLVGLGDVEAPGDDRAWLADLERVVAAVGVDLEAGDSGHRLTGLVGGRVVDVGSRAVRLRRRGRCPDRRGVDALGGRGAAVGHPERHRKAGRERRDSDGHEAQACHQAGH